MSYHHSSSTADISEVEKTQMNPALADIEIDARDRDLLERQRELEDLDSNTKTNWEMIKKLTVCGVAFLNDAYDMFAINIVAMILGFVYYHDAPGSAQNTVPKKWDTLIKIAVQIGCLLGQLVMGRLGDKIGRTTVYSASLMIAIITTIASAFSNSMVKGINVFVVLFIWRYASVHNRGKMISAVFSCQGFGNVMAPIVGIIITAIFKSSIDDDVLNLDYVWRLMLGLGCVPGVATLYWRLTMEDSKRFQMETAKAAAANADEEVQQEKLLAKQQYAEGRDAESGIETPTVPAVVSPAKPRRAKTFTQYFSEWKHLKVLLGTSIAWFALDVAFYGINLNSSIVIDAIGFAGDIHKDKPSHFIIRNCLGNIIINLLGSVPGYWIAVFTIEKLGRKKIQLMGFAALTILYIILGFAYHQILDKSTAGFIVLFTLAQLFQNFGPNVTTFVIPGEVFPTRFRSTAHGISAAAGKLGAIVAQGGFMQLKDRGGKNMFINRLLQIFALFMLVGLIVTFWIPESKGKTLEEICDESEEYY
ncbi:MFS general substrate transporter [Martensiomyces pterosporus]|nr:MFS general substrate transporter [Martensiomyces pterosporus]